MITQRFRPLGWVAGVATAATFLYLISVQVAAERGRLEAIDAKILAAKRDIRQLQTELGTRASLRQLERWNGEVLALRAPVAEQFLSSEAELSSPHRQTAARAGIASAQIAAPRARATETDLVRPDQVASLDIRLVDRQTRTQATLKPKSR